ncbi:MAG TPA: recombination protein NinG [Casimicrobium sp.]|jgi:hypothetical protein|nr:recombination protein NinG [Casimicrobium sp.]
MKRSPIKSRSSNPRAKAVSLAQSAVNAYVRARDEGKPCISCGEMKPLQAGHYWSVGARPELRFNEANIHGQCHRCNIDLAGNREAFRAGIVDRLGSELADDLDTPTPAQKFTLDDLKAILANAEAKRAEIVDFARAA